MNFLLGEQRHIRVQVTSKKQQVIVITDAEYTITDRKGNLTTSGQCNINGAEMSMLYIPDNPGVYTFEVTYVIPPETLKARCDLSVT